MIPGHWGIHVGNKCEIGHLPENSHTYCFQVIKANVKDKILKDGQVHSSSEGEGKGNLS